MSEEGLLSIHLVLFSDYFNEVESEEEPKIGKNNEPASEEAINSMLKHIGGFNKWTFLNDDCKRNVIKYLNFKDKGKLGMCSKSDHLLVEKVPASVVGISILEQEYSLYHYESEHFENVTVRVSFDYSRDSRNELEVVFSPLPPTENGKDTLVRWLKYLPRQRPQVRQLTLQDCNYYAEAVKFSESWMKRCKYGLEWLTVKMASWPFDSTSIKFLPKCSSLSISCDTEEQMWWWLSKVPERLESLCLSTHTHEKHDFVLSEKLMGTPQIMTVKWFYFRCEVALSDDQFINMEAGSIACDTNTITDKGINQFLKKWKSGNGVKDFKDALIWTEREKDESQIIEGLEARPWDDEFEEEARGFCDDFNRVCGRGDCFQIYSKTNPYDSVTLMISDDRVLISKTGSKMEHEGKIWVDYSIP